ncbi:nucleotide-binding alpha-beta plait domain-containing protein [Tanacetum coccineum]
MVITGSQRTKEDDVQKISTSVFVTNFPDGYGAKDLWNTCKLYGHVVDAYIPDRRSKTGKRFGFVQFIKVFDVDRLVNNLCTVWVGCNKLHANVARFQRELLKNHSHKLNENGMNWDNTGGRKSGDGAKGTANLYAHVVKGNQGQKGFMEDSPSLVLDETCLNQGDYSLCLLGKVKEFASLRNLKVVLGKEGYANIELKYMGGFWVMIVFQDEKTKNRFLSNLAVGTWFSHIIQAHNDFVIDERVIWVEVEGVPCKWWSRNTFSRIASRWGWVPDFEEDSEEEYDSYDGSHEDEVQGGTSRNLKDVKGDSDVDEVPETNFEEVPDKHTFEDKAVRQKDSLKYPPTFTPNEDGVAPVERSDTLSDENRVKDGQEDGGFVEKQVHEGVEVLTDTHEASCSGHFKKSEIPRTGGSIIQLIDDLVNVGQTMRYDMTGCIKNMEVIIESQGVNDVHR